MNSAEIDGSGGARMKVELCANSTAAARPISVSSPHVEVHGNAWFSEPHNREQNSDESAWLRAECASLSSTSGSLSDLDEAKVVFMSDALASDFFSKVDTIHQHNRFSIDWMAGRTWEQIMHEREATIVAIEKAADSFKSAGWCKSWFENCDEQVKLVAQGVNGPLCQQLAESINYHDWGGFTQLRDGARFLGKLDCTGHGTRKAFEPHEPIDELITA